MTELSLARFTICSKCHVVKPLEPQFFHRAKKSANGFNPWCKTCMKLYSRRRYKRDKDRILDRTKRYYRNNAERYAEYHSGYRKTNHEYYRQKVLTYKARKRAQAGMPYTASDIAEMYAAQGGRCYYCDIALGGRYEIDHRVPICRGGLDGLENITISCKPCNRRKGRRTDVEFMQRE